MQVSSKLATQTEELAWRRTGYAPAVPSCAVTANECLCEHWSGLVNPNSPSVNGRRVEADGAAFETRYSEYVQHNNAGTDIRSIVVDGTLAEQGGRLHMIE